MKNKIRNLLFIVFLCIFVYPFIYYFIQSIERFTDKSPYGQWELVLRQSYNDQFVKSPFKGNVSVNIEALYDEYGHINEPNYYNSSLYSKYDFSSNRILKLNYYDTYESKTPTTITWSQDIIETDKTGIFNIIVIRSETKKDWINLSELQLWINNINVLPTNIRPSLETGLLTNTNTEFIDWSTKTVLVCYKGRSDLKASNICNNNITGIDVHSGNTNSALYIPLANTFNIQNIQSVVLYNRTTCCQYRINGFKIEFYYTDLVNPIYSIPINTTQNVYRWDFPSFSKNTPLSSQNSTTQINSITPQKLTHNFSGSVKNVNGDTLPDGFYGLIQSTDSSYVFVGYPSATGKYVLGASQTYLDSITDVSYIPGYTDTGVEKVELYLWNPRPNNKNTFNGNYKNLTISKVDMNDTTHKNFWNKSEDVSGLLDETNRYSYCFGKLRCNDNLYTPIENSKGNYKPYCNSDSSLNPVYCEGSALYNTNSTTFNPVSIGSLTFDMMGKYASYDVSNESYFNLFRGLTTPYNSDYIDPEISGNDVVMYDTKNSTFVKNNICNFLDNTNLINGTNLQEECELTRYTGITDDISFADTSGNKCIANYGDTINSKYKDYVCKKNEVCIGYECGVQFGKCSPSLL